MAKKPKPIPATIGDPTVSSVTEDFAINGSGFLTASGFISISDPDSPATFQTTVKSSGKTLGVLLLNPDGTYTYSVSNSDVQYLGAGETLVESFKITSSDGTQKTISFTIYGVNDEAVIGDPPNSTVTEDTLVDAAGNLTATGRIPIVDADKNQSSFQTTVIAGVGTLGSLTINPSGNYTYTIANSSVQYLALGETRVETFTVTSVGGATKTVNFTITGANDIPVVTGAVVAAVTDTDTSPASITLLANASDPDLNDDLDVSNISYAVTAGTWTNAVVYTVDAETGILTLDPTQFAALRTGESLEITFSYDVTDNNGGVMPTTAVVAILGANNAPTGTPTAVLTDGTEDVAYTVAAADLLAGFTDPEGDTLSVANLTASNGTVSDNGDGTYTITPTLNFNGPVTLSYDVIDGKGGSLPGQSLSYNVDAVNDAPEIRIQGNLDIVTTNFNSNNVGVLLGDGAGSFTSSSVDTGGGVRPASAALGDLNGDALIDIVTANYGTSNVSVLLGDGLGNFTASTTGLGGGSNPPVVALADVNGDGKLDILTANDTSGDVSVLLGDGAGGFSANAVVPSGGSNTVSLAVGDLNHDGSLDVVTANQTSNNVGILLGDGAGGFTTSTTGLGGGSTPFSVTLGDFNNDGNLDVATANQGTSQVSILLGDGTGGFSATTVGTGSFDTYSVAVGDLNGDGKLDIVTANRIGNNVSILLGDGTGSFTVSTVGTGGGQFPWYAALSDLDGDGDLDIATSNSGSNNVSVLINDGNGAFTASLVGSGGFAPISLAIGDVNNAQVVAEDTSLVFGSLTGNAITLTDVDAGSGIETVALGVAHGGLTLATTSGLTVIGDGSSSVSLSGTVADINAALDGLSYLPSADYNGSDTLTITANDNGESGAGGPLTTTQLVPIVVQPVNDAPIAYSFADAGTIIEDTIVSTVVDGTEANGIPLSALATDVDSILTRASITPVSATLNGTALSLTDAGISYDPATGLGLIDATKPVYQSLAAGEEATLVYTHAVSDGEFSTQATFTYTIIGTNDDPAGTPTAVLTDGTEDVAYTVAAADLLAGFTDPEGDTLSVANLAASNGTIADNGDGTYTIMPTADFNGPVILSYDVIDGKGGSLPGQSLSYNVDAVNDAPEIRIQGNLDIVTTNFSGGNVSVLLGDGAGAFAASPVGTPGSSQNAAPALGDVNGDGTIDILSANYGTSNVSILLGDGAGGFTASTTGLGGGLNPAHLAVGDLNADGKLDIVTANDGSSNVSVLLGDGAGTFSATTAPIGDGSRPVSVAVGDINADGKLDIVTANQGSSNISILLGDGAGGFTASTASIDSVSFSVALGDVNHDGKLDIIAANHVANTVSVLLADGEGGFTTSTVGVGGGISPQSVALGDLNGDGNLDIVTANTNSNNVSVLLGDGTGGFTASTTGIGGGLGPWLAALGDVNADGKLDIVSANRNSNTVSVLLGDGAGGFTAITTGVGASDPISVTLGDVNNAQVVAEDTSLVFGSLTGNAITLTDVDAGSGIETVALGVAHGGLTLATTSGLTVIGDGSSSVSLSGTVADINAALDGLSYLPSADYNGSDTLTITANDNGESGAGGPLTTTQLVPIVVQPVNDAPIAYSFADAGTIIEDTIVSTVVDGTEANGIPLSALATDVDSILTRASITPVSATLNGTALSLTDAGISYDPATGLGLIDATKPVYQSLAAGEEATLVYTHAVSDGEFSTQATFTYTVIGVNDDPTLEAALADQSATQGAAFSFAVPAGTFADVDNGDTLTLTASLEGGAPLPSWLSFDGATFSGTPTNEDVGTLTIVVTATDTGGLSVTDTFAVTIGDSNDAPSGADGTVTTAEDTAYTFSAADFGFSDPDAGDTLAAVRINTLPLNGTLALAGVAVSAGQAIAASDIANLTFTPAADAYDTGYASFTFSVSDGTAFSTSPNTLTIDVTPVNDAPVADPVTLSAIAEDSGARIITAAELLAGVTDGDGPPATITSLSIQAGNGTLLDNGDQTWTYTPVLNDDTSVTFAYTASDGEFLASSTASLDITPVNDAPVATSFEDAGTIIEDTIVSTVVDGTEANGIPLSALATDVDSILTRASITPVSATLNGTALSLTDAGISYDPATGLGLIDATKPVYQSLAAGEEATLVYTHAVSDGEFSTQATFTYTVIGVNDDPTLEAALADQSATQGAAFSFAVPAGTFADVDNGDTLTLTASLEGGAPLPSWLSFDGATFSGTPTNEDVGTLTIVVTATDTGGLSVTDTFAVTIGDSNDAPSGADGTVTTAEDTAYTFSAADFGFSDPDAGDTLAAVRINTLPLNGTLALAGVAVSAGQAIAASDIANLTFTPAADAYDTGYASFTFSVSDGTAFSTSPNTLTIDVTPVNDAPVADPVTLSAIAEDSGARIITAAELLAGVTDGDGPPATITSLSIQAGNGTLLDNGDQTWTYTPVLNDDTSVTFAYTASDGEFSASSTASLDITPVNDAPVATSFEDAGTIIEDTIVSTVVDGTEANGIPLSALATDVDSILTRASITPVSATLNGTALSLTDAGISYDPATGLGLIDATKPVYQSLAAGEEATLVYTHAVSDGEFSTQATFTYTVIGVNDDPTLEAALADQSATQGAAFSFAVPAGTFADVDNGDTLTLTASLEGGAPLPSWLSFDGATFSGTPTNEDVGTLTIVVTATDTGGLSVTDTFAVTIGDSNDAPSGADGTVTTAEDTAYTFSAADFGFSDPDAGDTLAAVRINTLPLNGTLALAGVAVSAGQAIAASDIANLTFTPAADAYDTGYASFTFSVSDGTAFSTSPNTLTIDVTPVNDAPVADPVTLSAIAEDSGARIITAAELLAGVTDGDGPPATITSLSIQAGNGTLLDNGDQTWTYTPVLNDDTSVTFAYTASDGEFLASSTASLDITPVNDAPVATSFEDAGTIIEDTIVSTVVDGTEANGIPLSALATDVDSILTRASITPVSPP